MYYLMIFATICGFASLREAMVRKKYLNARHQKLHHIIDSALHTNPVPYHDYLLEHHF
jgi:hypothetical protein